MATNLAFKILEFAVWDAAGLSDNVPPMPIDVSDGYIHLSTADQLDETLKLHFANAGEVLVLSINLDQVRDPLKWEESRGGNLFPHVYGVIPKSAIIDKHSARVDGDLVVYSPWSDR